MSAILMFFYWIVVPLVVFRLARWLFVRGQSRFIRGLIVAGTVVFFAWFLWIAVGRNMWLDHQVREMCAKDGGIKVYETVELTPDLLDWAGRVWIPFKDEEVESDKYYMELEKYYLRKTNPQIVCSTYRIIQKRDEKILGESIFFSRRGSGLPGPWHNNKFTCPDPAGESPGLSTLVFTGAKK